MCQQLTKCTGKTNRITITNDKGRLTKEEIEKMVQEAEKYKDEDDKVKKRVEAKNALENYCYTMKNTLNEEKLKEKFTDADKNSIQSGCDETLKWLQDHSQDDAEALEAKQKELEGKFNPIMTKIYQSAGGAPGGMPGGMPGEAFRGAGAGTAGATSGPGVDELD